MVYAPEHRIADLIFENGTVITVDSQFTTCEALAVSDGVIVALGSVADMTPWRGKTTRVVDLHGGSLLPGINDTHLHGALFSVYWPRMWMDDLDSWKRGDIGEPRTLDTDEKVHEAIDFVQQTVLSYGITSYTEPALGHQSVHQHGGSVGGQVLDAYLKQASEGRIKARVSVLLNFGELDGPCGLIDLEKGLGNVPESADPRSVRVGGVKLFGDGSPASRKGWMFEPYLGTDHDYGGLTMVAGTSEAERQALLRQLVFQSHEMGLQIGIHATGDHTVDFAVDAFIEAAARFGDESLRHYIIHGDCIRPATLHKMAQHMIGYTTQPSIYSAIGGLIADAIGTEAADHAFPLRSAFESGVYAALSSDTPAVTLDWRIGLVDAVTRSGARGDPKAEAISVEDAIRGYTINAAWLDHADSWKGSLEIGKVADLCVLERDVLTAEVEDIPSIEIRMTVIDGEIVFEKAGEHV